MPLQVLLFRSHDQAYIEAVQAAGAAAQCLPLLETAVNHAAIPDNVTEKYSAAVFTSGRAVEAVAEGRPDMDWRDFPVFVVGPATAGKVQSLLKSNKIQGAECGDAESLAELITSLHRGKPFDKPLLFCCGESRLDALPSALTEHKVPFEEVAVYKTEASETLVAAAARAVVAMAKDHEVALTFFSPSGARALMPAMAAAMNQQGLKSCVHLIALGPSTEAEIATQLEALGDRMLVAGRQTCDAPTAAAVAFCVAKIVSR